MSSLPARAGIEWLKQGFSLFRQQPGILTMLLFTNFLASVLLSNIPILGMLLMFLLIPSFSIAILQACNLISQGQRVLPDVLLTGFRRPAIVRLFKLGMVYVGLALVMLIVMRLGVDDATMQQAQANAAAAKAASAAGQPVAPQSPPPMVMIMVLVWGIVTMMLSFAAPLTHWKQMPLAKAIFYSVFGVIGAFKPIVVMLLSAMGMFIVLMGFVMLLFSSNAMILQAVVAWTLLMFTLILQCAMFACYRQLYADPAPDDKR